MTFRAAFYKGTRPGIQGLYNITVRAVTKGKYSHCEIVFTDGLSASATFLDGGVRFKKIDYNPAHWDFIELPAYLEADARAWFEAHNGQGYDVLGNIRFLFWPIPEEKQCWFCSEAIGKALRLPDAWRYDPNVLHSALTLAKI